MTNKRRCSKCIFGDICSSKKICDDYSPIDEYEENVHSKYTFKKDREEFYRDWWEYINEYED